MAWRWWGQMASELLSHGQAVKRTSATSNSIGVWICQHGQAQHITSYPADVVDAIGTGDAHCAGLLAGLVSGNSLIQASELANCVAACMYSSECR